MATYEDVHVKWVEATASMRELVGVGSYELATLLLMLAMRVIEW